VIAETVPIVPEVSGKISEIHVSDNQLVKKGEVLFMVDREKYALALQAAEATLAIRKNELDLKKDVAARRRKLSMERAISTEETQVAENALEVAGWAVNAAESARDMARLDLERTVVTSPVNGYITNLHLRAGDYATSGQPQFSIIDSDSFWVAGYFEETKLVSVHPGDRARMDLMGGRSLSGRVESISRGIADATTTTKGLADVDPVFSWVRLAQRIPVRIKIDQVPGDVFLSSGMTCNVHLSPGREREPGSDTHAEAVLLTKAR
jgi:RND family efflux transporter MFP subunit